MGLRSWLGLKRQRKKSRALLADSLSDISARLPNFDMRVVLDVGANVGQTIDGISRVYPAAEIFAIEPVGASFKLISDRFSSNQNVHCIHAAMGSKARSTRITARGTASNNKIVDENFVGDQESVEMITGDTLCFARGLAEVSFLKIDTEGYDLEVLLGFRQMLKTERISLVQVEAGMGVFNTSHVPFFELHDYLTELGYHVFGFYDQSSELNGRPVLRRADVIFISTPCMRENTST
jgi:FkbM family methyltransferase